MKRSLYVVFYTNDKGNRVLVGPWAFRLKSKAKEASILDANEYVSSIPKLEVAKIEVLAGRKYVPCFDFLREYCETSWDGIYVSKEPFSDTHEAVNENELWSLDGATHQLKRDLSDKLAQLKRETAQVSNALSSITDSGRVTIR